MPTPEQVKQALEPMCAVIADLALADAAEAEATLNQHFPLSSLGEVENLLKAAQAEGWLTPKRASPDLTFGRLAKASTETYGLSIDIVDMTSTGAEHVHPNGEVSLCFVVAGEPTFCGRPAGWVVVPPGSQHVPTVAGGHMLIAYFLPSGAMTWI